MCSLERFDIHLRALGIGENALSYELDDAFFKALDSEQVHGGSLHVSGSIRKATGFYELCLHTAGTVSIACDRCLDDMSQPVEADLRLVIKEGAQRLEEDELIVVDEQHPVVNVAWPIYESVVLAIPIRHVHQSGGCNEAMMRVLGEHSAARSSDAEAKDAIDTRWDALKNLKI